MLRDHLPLQQGLRQLYSEHFRCLRLLRDHLPLQQGLRHLYTSFSLFQYMVLRDHLPLQQGLRQMLIPLSNAFQEPQRPSSITTRIKTP